MALVYCLQNFDRIHSRGFIRWNIFQNYFADLKKNSNFSIAYFKKWLKNQILNKKSLL